MFKLIFFILTFLAVSAQATVGVSPLNCWYQLQAKTWLPAGGSQGLYLMLDPGSSKYYDSKWGPCCWLKSVLRGSPEKDKFIARLSAIGRERKSIQKELGRGEDLTLLLPDCKMAAVTYSTTEEEESVFLSGDIERGQDLFLQICRRLNPSARTPNPGVPPSHEAHFQPLISELAQIL